jgi:hypothetical protein
MRYFRCRDCEASLHLCITNVDLNEDAQLRMLRLRSFSKFMHHKCRPQRGCANSDARIAKLVHIYASQTSTSTRMRHFGCPDCDASRNLCITNVDLNEDAPLRMPSLRSFSKFTHHACRPQRGCTTSNAPSARPDRGLSRIRPKIESCSKRRNKELTVLEVCQKNLISGFPVSRIWPKIESCSKRHSKELARF